MKARALKDGDLIEVGDVIRAEHLGTGTDVNRVTRVTPKWAFVRVSDVYEQKFARLYDTFGFAPIPKSTWRTTSYTAWRPVDVPAPAKKEAT